MKFHFRTIPSKIFLLFFAITVLFVVGFGISSYLFRTTINRVVLHFKEDIVSSFNDNYLADVKANRLDVISSLIDEKIERISLIFNNLERNVDVLATATKDIYDHHRIDVTPNSDIDPIAFSKKLEFKKTLKKDKNFLNPVSFEFPDILIYDSNLISLYNQMYWRLTPFLKAFYGKYNSILWTYVGFQKDGSVLNFPGNFSEPDGYDPRTRPWYQKAHKNKGEAVWTEPYFDTGNKSLVLTVAKATYGSNTNEPLFVSAADIVVEKLIRDIININIDKSMLPILILNESNQVIFKRDDEDLMGDWKDIPKFISSSSFFSKEEHISYNAIEDVKYSKFEFRNKNYFVFKRRLPRANWSIVFLLDSNYIDGFTSNFEKKFNSLAKSSFESVENSKNFSDRILFLIAILLCVFITTSFILLNRMVVNPLRQLLFLIKNFGKISLDDFLSKDFERASGELREISDELKNLKESEIVYKETRVQQEILKAENEINAQISHDIRSPLAALNMVLGEIKELPEDYRLIIRNATQRINDIANGLLKKGTRELLVGDGYNVIQAATPIMLVALLDSILSEKRVQFRERLNLEISGELNDGYGLFANLNPVEFSRVISNLINNSAEAISIDGVVSVSINGFENEVVITVCDNGVGIPPEILERLGDLGVTHGKAGTTGGSGLGIYHAKKTIENLGGRFSIESTVGVGTKVSIMLPRCSTPQWFVKFIKLKPNDVIVSVDDDQTIHQIWSGRIQTLNSIFHKSVSHVTFSSGEKFEQWLENGNRDSVSLFLIDFELLNQPRNGLAIIEQLGIQEKSILVTSRFEESNVSIKSESLGVQMLPKTLAAFVPFSFESELKKYSAVLIDDDKSIIHTTWKMAAAKKEVSILCFSNAKEFWMNASYIDRDSAIFVDVNLGDGVRGEKIAQEIMDAGFTNVSLTTGFDPKLINVPQGIKRVVGKDPLL
tara:strand:- start:77876 stop:80728 length:2853 start_codon:yes stop_codon:yes gene_type:complete